MGFIPRWIGWVLLLVGVSCSSACRAESICDEDLTSLIKVLTNAGNYDGALYEFNLRDKLDCPANGDALFAMSEAMVKESMLTSEALSIPWDKTLALAVGMLRAGSTACASAKCEVTADKFAVVEAMVFSMRGRSDESIQKFERAEALGWSKSNYSPDGWISYARLKAEVGDFDAATRLLRMAKERGADKSFWAATVYIDELRYGDKSTILARIRKDRGVLSEIELGHCYALEFRKKFLEAKQCYDLLLGDPLILQSEFGVLVQRRSKRLEKRNGPS